jgi:hypothetical protein
MQESNDYSVSQNNGGAKTESPEARPNGSSGTAQPSEEAPVLPPAALRGNGDDLLAHGESETDSLHSGGPVAQIATAGVDLSGVTPISELIRWANGRIVTSRLAPYENKSVIHANSTGKTLNGPSYRVPPMSPGVYRSLVLPTAPKLFGSARQLFSSIAELLEKHVPLPKPERSLVSYWAMATWFADVLQLCPTLVVTGSGSAANLLLRTLVAVCRRPLLLADATAATLRALPLGELLPTLLMRSPQLSKQMIALLDDSTHPGYLVSSGKDFQQFYCPKCIYVGEDATSHLKSSNSIRIHVGGSITRSFSAPPTGDVITDFQDRLLAYRFLGRNKVISSNFHVSGFRPETSAIAEALGAAIVDDPEWQNGVTLLLKAHDEQSRVEHSSGTNGIVLRALLFHCHESNGEHVFVREIADTANRISSDDGESGKLSSEKVGHVLRNLGLYTRRLGSGGRGLVIDKQTQMRTHRLSHAYDVPKTEPACILCHPLKAE